jgi:hypothetical protein
MSVIYVLWLIVVPLPPGKNSFSVKINNNTNNNIPAKAEDTLYLPHILTTTEVTLFSTCFTLVSCLAYSSTL